MILPICKVTLSLTCLATACNGRHFEDRTRGADVIRSPEERKLSEFGLRTSSSWCKKAECVHFSSGVLAKFLISSVSTRSHSGYVAPSCFRFGIALSTISTNRCGDRAKLDCLRVRLADLSGMLKKHLEEIPNLSRNRREVTMSVHLSWSKSEPTNARASDLVQPIVSSFCSSMPNPNKLPCDCQHLQARLRYVKMQCDQDEETADYLYLANILLGVIWTALYFIIGVTVYGNLEGWSPLDASYFMVVTSTTVGYGDLAPQTDAGKVFTCLYALLGTTLIIGYLTPVLEAILTPIRSSLERMIELSVDTRNLTISLAEVNRRISYPKRYLRASIGPIMLIALGTVYASSVLDLTPVDSLYWSMITMTTIGFGDISPASSPAAKLFAIFYLPLAVTALADAISAISAIEARRSIREASELLQAEELLLQESKGNPYHMMTEAEYLMRVLVDSDIVDEDTCIAVLRKFSSITCEDDAEKCTIEDVRLKSLDSRTVYNLLKRRGQLAGNPEGTYEAWFEDTWKTWVAEAARGNG